MLKKILKYVVDWMLYGNAKKQFSIDEHYKKLDDEIFQKWLKNSREEHSCR